jgi:hypothetical protein
MNSQDFRAYMEEALARTGSSGRCPTAEELTDYIRNTCDADVTESIRSHVVACADCRGNILELSDFVAEDVGQSQVPSPAELDRDWKILKRRLRSDARGSWWSALTRMRFLPVLAGFCAILLAAALVWSIVLQNRMTKLQVAHDRVVESERQMRTETAALRRRLEVASAESRAPQLNLTVFAAMPEGVTERSAGVKNANAFELSASGRFALLLIGAGEKPAAEYSVSIRDNQEHEVFSGSGLKPDKHRNLMLSLNTRLLPAGEYRFLIRESADAKLRTTAAYSVRLVNQLPSPNSENAAQK